MKQQDFKRLTAGYESAVQHPEVSGMEHLQLFQIRSQLADYLSKLPVRPLQENKHTRHPKGSRHSLMRCRPTEPALENASSAIDVHLFFWSGLTQQNRIRQADQVLLVNAEQFLQAINEIADLSSWRSRRDAPPTHWWWYLDVIVHLPVNLPQATQTIFAEPALV